jgi:hypothetical protein
MYLPFAQPDMLAILVGYTIHTTGVSPVLLGMVMVCMAGLRSIPCNETRG